MLGGWNETSPLMSDSVQRVWKWVKLCVPKGNVMQVRRLGAQVVNDQVWLFVSFVRLLLPSRPIRATSNFLNVFSTAKKLHEEIGISLKISTIRPCSIMIFLINLLQLLMKVKAWFPLEQDKQLPDEAEHDFISVFFSLFLLVDSNVRRKSSRWKFFASFHLSCAKWDSKCAWGGAQQNNGLMLHENNGKEEKISNSVYLLFDRQPKPMKKKELRCVVLSLLPPPLVRMPSIPIKKLWSFLIEPKLKLTFSQYGTVRARR